MRIQLYVLRQLLISFGFALAGIGLIVMPTMAIQAINKLGAISPELLLKYLPLVAAKLVPYLLPMAFLLGIVATYGRLSADRELIAIHMAGFHPARLLVPGLIVAVPLAGLTDFLLGEASPAWDYLQRESLRKAEVAHVLAATRGTNLFQWKTGSLMSEENYGNVRKNVLLDLEVEGGRQLSIAAEEAVIDVIGDEKLQFRLKNATVLTDTARVFDESPTYTVKLSELFPSQPKDRAKPKYMTNGEMREELASGKVDAKLSEEFRYEIHRRHALSCTYLLFLLLGIPTGVVLRSSTQLGAFTGAVGYAFLYYVLAMRLGKVLAETGAIPALVAAWATNGLFLLIGLFFFARALLR